MHETVFEGAASHNSVDNIRDIIIPEDHVSLLFGIFISFLISAEANIGFQHHSDVIFATADDANLSDGLRGLVRLGAETDRRVGATTSRVHLGKIVHDHRSLFWAGAMDNTKILGGEVELFALSGNTIDDVTEIFS